MMFIVVQQGKEHAAGATHTDVIALVVTQD